MEFCWRAFLKKLKKFHAISIRDEKLPRLMIVFFLFAQNVILHHFLSYIFFSLVCSFAESQTEKGHLVFFCLFFIAFIFIFIFAKDYCVGSLYYWIKKRHFSLFLLFCLLLLFSLSWFVCLHKNTIINTS